MKASAKIKLEILKRAGLYLDGKEFEDVSSAYEHYREDYEWQDNVIDVEHGLRSGYDCETNIPAPYDRHYEVKAVAKKLQDGTWVGWDYWYGGGKHGAAHEIEWIDDAYNLECTEKEVLQVVRTFNKKDED